MCTGQFHACFPEMLCNSEVQLKPATHCPALNRPQNPNVFGHSTLNTKSSLGVYLFVLIIHLYSNIFVSDPL